MFRNLFNTKKTLLLFFTSLLLSSSSGFAQDTTSVSFEIQNPLQVTPQQYEVLGVEVSGLTTTRPSFVVATSGLQEGTQITYPGDDIPNAINQLKRTGLFSDIKIIRKRTTSSGIYLEIRVTEQPKLEAFEIRGVKNSQRKDLREQINLLKGFAVTDASKAQAIRTIKDYYDEEGYWFTEVEVSTSETDEVRNRVTLYFDINPGEKLEIKDITFEGNDSFTDAKLRRQLKEIGKSVV